MDLANEINQLSIVLDNKISELPKNNREYADAYTEYRVILAQKLLLLRSDGMPVTIAYDIARGDDTVAKAKRREIYAEGIYKANIESIQALKLQIKLKQEQLNNEWSRPR